MEQEILAAAEKLFLAKGFALTSTTEIAREAGCNQALVHYYFRTKERLFQAVFEKLARLFVSTFLQIDEEDLSFEERLQKKIEAHFDIISANPALPVLFFNELSTNPQRLEEFRSRVSEIPSGIFQRLREDLEREIARGAVRPMDVFELVLTVVSLNVGLFLTAPLFKALTGITDERFQELAVRRKSENVRIVLTAVKP